MVNTNGLRLAALISLYAPLGCSEDRFPEFHYDNEIGADNVNFYEKGKNCYLEVERNDELVVYEFSACGDGEFTVDCVRTEVGDSKAKFCRDRSDKFAKEVLDNIMNPDAVMKDAQEEADKYLKAIADRNRKPIKRQSPRSRT